ncbi:hypothetical protein [Actinoplanes sp. L3-i22]|uniref:hypothetical protein n=1 Tax=Actinoplanes sp. L3-i22 TaxID=2836373 RepID=UPI001C780A7D|nr:hypothetical protein [Actinoplanes sp. L3-i22]BCY08797.1 hypothetical protein L3i22_038850 [Actinoplanes sp. L3-i22]
MEALQAAVTTVPDLKGLGTALNDAGAYLGKACKDIAAAGAQSDTIARCEMVIAAADNSTAVHDAAFELQGTAGEIDAAAVAVPDALSVLDDDLAAYRATQVQAPDYTDGGDPNDAAINELRTRAQKLATSWKSQAGLARKKMDKPACACPSGRPHTGRALYISVAAHRVSFTSVPTYSSMRPVPHAG